jgi:outer membrane protein assembly factor BamD
MKKAWVIIFSLIIGGLLLTSCGPEAKVVKRMNNYIKKGSIAQRDSAAFYFYNKKNYEKASFLFEELMSLRRGGPQAANYLYHFAYCKYYQGYFISASYYFQQYTQQYPNDSKTEECAYMIAYCYYQQSDPFFLDQTYTQKALDQFQVFINIFPGSEKVEEANELMAKMRETMAHKNFEQAKLYLKIDNYKAAVEAFLIFLREYPDSRYREEAQFLLIQSALELADASIQSRKRNRYLDTLEFYQKFVDRYPSSAFIKDAEGFFAKAKRELGKIQAASNSSR